MTFTPQPETTRIDLRMVGPVCEEPVKNPCVFRGTFSRTFRQRTASNIV